MKKDSLDSLLRKKQELQNQINQTSIRMHERKDMNDRHWNERAQAVEESKKVSQSVREELQNRVEDMNR